MLVNQDSWAFGRQCETAWSGWLRKQKYVVTLLHSATNNTAGTAAPMCNLTDGTTAVLPDLQVMRDGKGSYHEIKGRTRSYTHPDTGELMHGTDLTRFADYLKVQEETGMLVELVVYERPSSTAKGRWLRIKLQDANSLGRVEKNWYSREGWIWPVSAMEIVESGPAVDIDESLVPVVPVETGVNIPSQEEFKRAEETIRRASRLSHGRIELNKPEVQSKAVGLLTNSDMASCLDVLRRSLGIRTQPRYSIFRIGTIDVDSLEALLHYGIRVFLITPNETEGIYDRLQGFIKIRMLELEVIPDVKNRETWVVDGAFPEDHDWAKNLLDQADEKGGINGKQYLVVHASDKAHVEVQAGAGTGKTETMVERVIFLLATSMIEIVKGTDIAGETARYAYGLQPDQITMVTFTQDAARQMRERLARSLALRRRMCQMPVHPVVAWMTRVSSMRISTIHIFAKELLKTYGTSIGVASDFNVGSLTMPIRRLIEEELSMKLAGQYAENTPAHYEMVRLLENMWEQLGSNGVQLLSIPGVNSSEIEWGNALNQNSLIITNAVRDIIRALRNKISDLCFRQQTWSTNDLVPMALGVLKHNRHGLPPRITHLFMDEFQDTDPLQMDLILQVLQRSDAKLFYVGDVKQGVYRFRGAEGDAFTQMRKRGGAAFQPNKYILRRNFRSGKNLLDSFHNYFLSWAEKGFLNYQPADRLLAHLSPIDTSYQLEARRYGKDQHDIGIVSIVKSLKQTYAGSRHTIAFLCRQNSEALEIQKLLMSQKISCNVLIGGDFFRTPAVRDMGKFLEALTAPHNDAAVLELLESAWGPGLCKTLEVANRFISEAQLGIWKQEIQPFQNWPDRLVSTVEEGIQNDLQVIRQRLEFLGERARAIPPFAFLRACISEFSPESSFTNSEMSEHQIHEERIRYRRCMDHLFSIFDETFKLASVTFGSIQRWLQIQMATNNQEDEPLYEMETQDISITALTAHRAKGQEYDHVVIPETWKSFFYDGRDFKSAVRYFHESEIRRIKWSWKINQIQYGNVHHDHDDDFEISDKETRNEEARLLYVAMTRAKQTLNIFVPARPQKDSWAQLLDIPTELVYG